MGLGSLVAALEPEMCALHLYHDRATLELSIQPASVAEAIDGVVSAVERLAASDRAAWQACETRSCNIGIQAGIEPYAATFVVPPSCIAGLGRIGADLVFTVYCPR